MSVDVEHKNVTIPMSAKLQTDLFGMNPNHPKRLLLWDLGMNQWAFLPLIVADAYDKNEIPILALWGDNNPQCVALVRILFALRNLRLPLILGTPSTTTDDMSGYTCMLKNLKADADTVQRLGADKESVLAEWHAPADGDAFEVLEAMALRGYGQNTSVWNMGGATLMVKLAHLYQTSDKSLIKFGVVYNARTSQATKSVLEFIEKNQATHPVAKALAIWLQYDADAMSRIRKAKTKAERMLPEHIDSKVTNCMLLFGGAAVTIPPSSNPPCGTAGCDGMLVFGVDRFPVTEDSPLAQVIRGYHPLTMSALRDSEDLFNASQRVKVLGEFLQHVFHVKIMPELVTAKQRDEAKDAIKKELKNKLTEAMNFSLYTKGSKEHTRAQDLHDYLRQMKAHEYSDVLQAFVKRAPQANPKEICDTLKRLNSAQFGINMNSGMFLMVVEMLHGWLSFARSTCRAFSANVDGIPVYNNDPTFVRHELKSTYTRTPEELWGFSTVETKQVGKNNADQIKAFEDKIQIPTLTKVPQFTASSVLITSMNKTNALVPKHPQNHKPEAFACQF